MINDYCDGIFQSATKGKTRDKRKNRSDSDEDDDGKNTKKVSSVCFYTFEVARF